MGSTEVLKNQAGDPLRMGLRDPHSDRTADVVQVEDERPGRAMNASMTLATSSNVGRRMAGSGASLYPCRDSRVR